MKRWLAIFLFLVFALAASAQEEMRVVDSLENVMAQQEGREKVETMMELSKAFFDFSFDECVDWGEKAIEEATRFHDEELLAKAYWKIGMRYLNHYEFDLALENYNEALKLLKNKDDSELLEDVLNYKGRVELFMGEMDLAWKTYQQALQVSEKLGDELNCADVINNMAYIYFQQDELDKALEYFQDARKRYVQQQDTLSAMQCDNNISNIYVEWQRFDVAQTLLQKAIPVFEKIGDEASLAHAYQNLGTVYATGYVNLDSAMVYLRKSIVCAENVGDRITLVEDEIELANVLKRLNRDKDAVSLYQTALHSSEAIGYQNGVLGAYRHLGIHYNEVGDFTTSAVYLIRCMDLASEKGNQLYVNTVRPYLIDDYARLGQLIEMKKELGLMHDNYLDIFNENKILSGELSRVQVDMEGLLGQYESQNEQIETLCAQRNHYRLAFFGLLAIALVVMAIYVLRRILRHNRNRTK